MNFKSLLTQLDQLNEATEKTKTGLISTGYMELSLPQS